MSLAGEALPLDRRAAADDLYKAGVSGRVWFFRPISAYKSKHQVLANKPKKVRVKKGAVAAVEELA